jgi:hypothetical protein
MLAPVAFAVAIAFPIFPRHTQADELAHHALATSLLSGQGFAVDGYPELSRVPGYSLLLAAVIAPFPIPAHGYVAVTLNALLLLWATWTWAYRVLPLCLAGIWPRGGYKSRMASDIFALGSVAFPPYWAYVRMLMSEVFALWLLSMFLWLWCLALASPRCKRRALLTGIAFASLNLTKPIFLPLLPFLAATHVIAKQGRVRQTLETALLAGAIALLVMSPWLLRNRAIGGRWSVNLVGGAAFLYFGAVHQGGADPEAQRLHYGVAASGHVPPDVALVASDKLMAMAKQEIAAHPDRWLLLRIDAIRRLWFTSHISAIGCDPGREEYCNSPQVRLFKAGMLTLTAFLWVAALFAPLSLRLNGLAAFHPIWGTALCFTAMSCLGWAGGRYAIPVMPALFCFAAIGVAAASGSLVKRGLLSGDRDEQPGA